MTIDPFFQKRIRRLKDAVECGHEWTARDGEKHRCFRDTPNHKAQHKCLCGATTQTEHSRTLRRLQGRKSK